MRQAPQRLVIVTLSACLAGSALAACGDDSAGDRDSASEESIAAPTEATDSASVGETFDAEGTVLGGAELGFTVVLPDGWVDFEPTGEDLTEALEESGFDAGESEFVQEAIQQLADIPGAVFALEASSVVESGGTFAVNLNGYCIPGDGVSDIKDLRTVQEIGLEGVGADIVEISETTLAEVPALRTTYDMSTGDVEITGLQYVFIIDDEVCFITFSTDDASDLPSFEEIAATVALD